MSATSTRLPLARAQQLAAAIVGELAPGCERIEVAGSIRRRRPDIGDIEIVAIPKRNEVLFAAETELDRILAGLVGTGRLVRIKGGERYKQFALPHHGVNLDLFLCDRETWGVCLMIRTGPAEFSKRMVKQASKGGYCPDDMSFSDNMIWHSVIDGAPASEDVPISTPEEQDVFTALGLKWVKPWERS